jgi:hypothetical protein
MGPKRPTVWVEAWSVPPVAWLEELGQGRARIRLDTAEWIAWLDEPGASFAYPVFNPSCGYIEGFMTVRKEGRQRGGSYWRVYRRCGAKVRKVYVGRPEAVTNERLAAIARAFLSEESLRQEAEYSAVSSY